MPAMFIVLAGGVVLCAIVATGGAVTALRARRWPSAAAWSVMALFLLGWAGNIAAKVALNPALLDNAPPGARP